MQSNRQLLVPSVVALGVRADLKMYGMHTIFAHNLYYSTPPIRDRALTLGGKSPICVSTRIGIAPVTR